MRPTPRFYWGLALFCMLAIVLWFAGLGAVGQYLWSLLAGLSRV